MNFGPFSNLQHLSNLMNLLQYGLMFLQNELRFDLFLKKFVVHSARF